MNELFEYIIATKRGDFSWVVPIVLVIFYAVAGLARAKQKRERPDEQENQQPTEAERKASKQWQQKALREPQRQPVEQEHREIPASKVFEGRGFDHEMPAKDREIAPQRQKVMRDMMAEVYRQATGMPPRQTAKPPRKAVRREPLHEEPRQPLPAKKPVKTTKPQPEKTPLHAEKLAGLDRMGEMQRAIVYSEILGKPVALRPDSNLPGLS